MIIGICDDDRSWRAEAARILREYGSRRGLTFEMIFFENVQMLERHNGPPPEVLFMDIELQKEDPYQDVSLKSGIDAARMANQLWPDCQVVYLTNYLYYATEVYLTNHVFFVLKEQFPNRVEDVFAKIFHEQSQKRRKLVFSTSSRLTISLVPEQILYFERDRRITRIVTKNPEKVHVIHDKMDQVMQKLPALVLSGATTATSFTFPR